MNTTRSFAAYHKDDTIRGLSSSGGVFHAIAEKTLSEGGVVFGAAFDGGWQVQHVACKNLPELHQIMQSKYVQSSVGNTYHDVKNALISGKKVLFCGTPCQVEGLIAYLGIAIKDDSWTKSLLTIDFICHGVPSRMVWRKYLSEVSSGREISSINFRDKTRGWRDFRLHIDFSNGEAYSQSHNKDPYMRGFLHNLYLRESCYECKFRGVDRTPDFTIADFWGVQELLPDFFDDKGTSIVMAHNNRAILVLESLSDKLNLCEIENAVVVQTNSPIIKSVNRNSKRDNFLAGCYETDISSRIVRNLHQPFIMRIKRKIKKMFHL